MPDVVPHKVFDEIGEIGRGIYKYKVVGGAFVLKDDSGDLRETKQTSHHQLVSANER